jgi:hypothetical protein
MGAYEYLSPFSIAHTSLSDVLFNSNNNGKATAVKALFMNIEMKKRL